MKRKSILVIMSLAVLALLTAGCVPFSSIFRAEEKTAQSNEEALWDADELADDDTRLDVYTPDGKTLLKTITDDKQVETVGEALNGGESQRVEKAPAEADAQYLIVISGKRGSEGKDEGEIAAGILDGISGDLPKPADDPDALPVVGFVTYKNSDIAGLKLFGQDIHYQLKNNPDMTKLLGL